MRLVFELNLCLQLNVFERLVLELYNDLIGFGQYGGIIFQIIQNKYGDMFRKQLLVC